MVTRTLDMRALVPACVFDDATVQELQAVYQPDTGVLNVLTPGALCQKANLVACPVYEGMDELPQWAKNVLSSATPKISRQELLQTIVATTRAALDAVESLDDSPAPAASEDEDPSPNQENDNQPEDADEQLSAGDEADRFCLLRDGGEIRAISSLGEMEVERYDLTRNIFSRNTGILETDVMANKRAIIIGCGSVGSLVAVELARAGVGNFLLVDMDLIEYHNVCRHRCGISDVGRRKPDAVADLIRNINPVAQVETWYTEIQLMPLEMIAAWCVPNQTIVFGCADNRDVDLYANEFAADYGVSFLGIGFWERAFAGEIFYWIPGSGHTCYSCAFGGDAGFSQRVEANHHIYTSQTDLAAVNFEPGIAVDIDFVTIIGVKLALDIFNRGDTRFTPRLLPYLTQYTLVCNTNNPAIGGVMAEIFSYPLQVTTSLQVRPLPNCPICGLGAQNGPA